MARQVRGDGWSLRLPEGVTGGALAHAHTHLLTMARFSGPAGDGSDLEVIVTTYVFMYGTVIEWAWERGYEIYLFAQTTLEKTPTRNFYDHLNLKGF